MTSVVLVVGCFDPLHTGHILHFLEAKHYGSVLVVSVTEDEHVNKPNRPQAPLCVRMRAVAQLKCVDIVMHSKSSLEALKTMQPFCFALGEEYRNKVSPEDVEWCRENDVPIVFTNVNVYSSTKILDDLSRRS